MAKATDKKAPVKSAKKPKAHKPTKAERQSEAEELLGRIEKAVEEADEAARELAERKEDYKRQKGVLENCREEVAKLVRARKEKRPLFDQKPKADQKPLEGLPIPADLQMGLASAPSTDGDWKSLHIVRLGLDAKRIQQIVDAGFPTIGALSQHISDQGEWWRNSIKGLGEKGREEVLEAFVNFWAAHPEFCKPEPAAT